VVHAVVDLEERYDDWGSLELAFGGASDLGVFVAPKYSNRNLFGSGVGFDAGSTLGQNRLDATGTFVFPRFLGSRFRLQLMGYGRREATVRLGVINSYGFSATLSREIVPKLRVFLRYEFKQVTRPETLIRPAGPEEDTTAIQVPTPTGGVGTGLDYD